MDIELVYADITEEDTDAVVNAANAGLYAGSGVCGAIHDAAGPELEDACMALDGRLVDAATGEEVTPEQIAEDAEAERAHYEALRVELETVDPDADVERLTDKEVVERLREINGEDDDESRFEITEDELAMLLAGDPIDDAEPDFDGAFSKRRTFRERCPEGEAIATPGFRLRAPHVIHAVGPRWSGGDDGEAELLDSVHRAIIRVADELGARSVSLPAISTGIFGFPLETAAPIAVNALREAGADSGVETVRITVIDRTNYNAYAAALGLPLEEDVFLYAWVDPEARSLVTEPTDNLELVGDPPRAGTTLAVTADDGRTWSLIEG